MGGLADIARMGGLADTARMAKKDKLSETVKNVEKGTLPINAEILKLAKIATMAQTAKFARVARLTKRP